MKKTLVALLVTSAFLVAVRGQELELCQPFECGRYPQHVESAVCADGVTVSGVGPCARDLEGQCQWLVNGCPEADESPFQESSGFPITDIDIQAIHAPFYSQEQEQIEVPVFSSIVDPCIRSGCNNELCSIDYQDSACTPLPDELSLCLARARCRLASDGTCGFKPDCYALYNVPRPDPTPVPTIVPVPTPTPTPTKRPDNGASPDNSAGGEAAVSPDVEAPVSYPPMEEDDYEPDPQIPDSDESTPPPSGTVSGSAFTTMSAPLCMLPLALCLIIMLVSQRLV